MMRLKNAMKKLKSDSTAAPSKIRKFQWNERPVRKPGNKRRRRSLTSISNCCGSKAT
jgi:hypothetical protein